MLGEVGFALHITHRSGPDWEAFRGPSSFPLTCADCRHPCLEGDLRQMSEQRCDCGPASERCCRFALHASELHSVISSFNV